MGQAAVELLVAARETGGPFKDLYDLCDRVESRGMNKKLLESLVKAGACDEFGGTRPELIGDIDSALNKASANARDREVGQASLFDIFDSQPSEKKSTNRSGNRPSLAVPDWPLSERLAYEKELLGFYITGHPLDEYEPEMLAFSSHSVEQMKEESSHVRDVRLCGLVSRVEIRISQKDKRPWAKVLFEDRTGEMEVLFFADSYAALSRAPIVGEVAIITGEVDRRDEQPKVRGNTLQPLNTACEMLLHELRLNLPFENWREPKRWDDLRELLMDAPGPVKLRILCTTEDGKKCEFLPAMHYGVTWTTAFKKKLTQFLEMGCDITSEYGLIAEPPKVAKKKRWSNNGS